jgi:hypothetical protein
MNMIGLRVIFGTPLTVLKSPAVRMLLTVAAEPLCVRQVYALFIVLYNCGDTFVSLLVFLVFWKTICISKKLGYRGSSSTLKITYKKLVTQCKICTVIN